MGQSIRESAPAILVVEDDEDIRSLARDMLSAEGYEVFDAEDGNAALAFLSRQPVDVLFTDLAMPGLNGLDLAEKAAARNPTLKILYTSGYAQHPSLCATARRRLSGAFLPKPYRPSELVARVRGLLDAG
jgi:two-component system, cell cycle sensor histidine kinase and response regulator CckA